MYSIIYMFIDVIIHYVTTKVILSHVH